MDEHKEHFRITYDWPILKENVMDVYVGASLIAIWQLIDLAHKENGKLDIKIETKVKAWFRQGCFGIDIECTAISISTVKNIFAWDTATAIANAITILWFSYGIWVFMWNSPLWTWLIWLYKKLKGTLPIEVITKQSSVIVRYIDPTDGNLKDIEVIPEVYRLYVLMASRKAIETLIATPLSKEWIDSFESEYQWKKVYVSKEESRYFEDISSQNVQERIYDNKEIILRMVNFIPDQKWKVQYEWRNIFVRIQDKDFIAKAVSWLEKFANNDRLICKILERTIELPDETSQKLEYEILQVYEHIPIKQDIVEQSSIDEINNEE